MSKQRIAIGLDVGANSVKMVCLEIKGKSINILAYKIKEYITNDMDVSIRDKISNEARLSAINEILKDIESLKKTYHKVIKQTVPIVVSLEGASVFIRVFKLPGVAKSKLAKIIAYEAQQQVPFPIEEVVWSYQCLRRVSPEETDVVLAAVRVNIARDFLNLLRIDVSDLVPPVIGLNNLLSRSFHENIQAIKGEAVAILDIGARTTNIIIIEKQNLWFRTIPIGGDAVTQAISSEYGISPSEAELLKREKGEIILEGETEPYIETKRMSTCIIKALTRLNNEILRSIEVYSSNFNSLGPKKILITGGGSELKNIGSFFNKKFRIDVDNLQIDKNFGISDSLKEKNFSKDSQRLGTALGLALQGLGLGKVILSLLPKEILQRYKWLNRQTYLTVVSGFLIFLWICFSGYNMQIARIYKADFKRFLDERKAMDFNKTQIINMQKELDSVRYRMDIIKKVKSAHVFWLDMVLDLEGLLPNNVWLSGIEPAQKEEGVKEKKGISPSYINYASGIIDLVLLGKTTGTYQDVITFRDALNNSKFFVRDSAQVISANPPVNGVRDFLIKVKANVAETAG